MEKEVIHHVSAEKLERLRKTESMSSDDSSASLVIGSTNLYDENGKMRLIPAPTPDPKGISPTSNLEGYHFTKMSRSVESSPMAKERCNCRSGIL
jgi:hypothetical protein